MQRLWLKDPAISRPERWLIEDAGYLRSMHRTLDLVFGHGSKTCLGTPIAMTELNKIFLELSHQTLRRQALESRPVSP